MVSYANRTRFFSRNGIQGRQQLDVQQIGAAFAEQRGLGERLRAWKADRVGKAIAGEGPVPLQGSAMLFHFISAPGLRDGGENLHPRVFDTEKLWRGCRLFYTSPDWARYNADGFLLATHVLRDEGRSYLQVFRDGSLEYGDSAMIQTHGFPTIASQLLEEKIIAVFTNALGFLRMLDTPEPVYASLTFTGMKGRVMALPEHSFRSGYQSEPFDRPVLLTPDVLIDNLSEGSPYPSTLLPIVNALWQAAGREATPYKNVFWERKS